MCRLFAFSFNKDTHKEERVLCLDSFRALAGSGAVLPNSTPGHADGWGLVVYKERGNAPHFYKSTLSALEDSDFEAESFLNNSIQETGLAHLRKKTVGDTSLSNTHPFVEGEYSFIHNGTVAKGDEPYARLTPLCGGCPDSERLFKRFLEIKNEGDGTKDAYKKMLEETKDLYPTYSAINTILHDSEHIYASRVINMENPNYDALSLENYYTLYIGKTRGGDVFVSSEQIPYKETTYILIPNDSMSTITIATGTIETFQLA